MTEPVATLPACQLLGYPADDPRPRDQRWCVTHNQLAGKCDFPAPEAGGEPELLPCEWCKQLPETCGGGEHLAVRCVTNSCLVRAHGWTSLEFWNTRVSQSADWLKDKEIDTAQPAGEPSELTDTEVEALFGQDDPVDKAMLERVRKRFNEKLAEGTHTAPADGVRQLSEQVVEDYIRSLPWSDAVTEDEKTLVAGNIRGFARYLIDPTDAEEAITRITVALARRAGTPTTDAKERARKIVDEWGGDILPVPTRDYDRSRHGLIERIASALSSTPSDEVAQRARRAVLVEATKEQE